MKDVCTNRRVHALALGALLLAGGGAVVCAHAQNYPSQGIRIIMPFAAGGGGDAVARIVAQQLSEGMGQPVVVENVTGAGGTLGTARAAQAPPNGYTLLVGTPSTHGTNVAV
jgi:tripartite-type tricarboxylate transporter receptor subunit TctC